MSLPSQSIAVLAHACRLPGADSPDAFWHNLATGIARVSEIPPTRWAVDQWFAPPPYQPGKSVTKWGAFLDDIQRFDATFFKIAAAEAQIMDPQQRILLELAHETLEQGGYATQQRQGLRIGVFLGIGQNGYSELTVPLLLSGQPTHPMLVANNIRNLVAGQIAHSLNLTGPALVVDTACSSSLVALHIARQSLLAGDCDLALVGGINLNITATPFVAFSSAGVLAPSAQAYVFDERANGFVLGEGGGMILLSTLEHAQAGHAPILGLIRGSAINNDGQSLGAMTPSPHGQEAVLRAAYATAAIAPATISYIEAHGTGTRIGDVIEARALTRCFPKPPPSGVRYLGTVKPNVGHLLSAAAMPSLLKVLLAFRHRQLPPTLHCEQARPIFKLAQAGFTLNQTLVDWTPAAPDQPLRAGVSSFGFGGTNAHVILEEPPRLAARAPVHPPYAFARTPYWVEDRRQRTEDRGQKIEDRGQKAEDRGQKVEGRGQKIEDRGQKVEGREVVVEPIGGPAGAAVIDGWLQRVNWVAAPLWDGAMANRCPAWLLLSAPTPAAQTLADRLALHLQGQGRHCSHHCCQQGDEADVDALRTMDVAGAGVVFIGPVGAVQPLDSAAVLETELAVGVFTFHPVARWLATLTPAQQPAGVWVVTAGAQGLSQDGEAIAPARAALTGLSLALGDELSATPSVLVDLAPTATVEIQLAQIAAELNIAATRRVLAWRQRQGHWTRLERQLCTMTVNAPAANRLVLQKGVYLITGGATGIGAEVARSLAGLGMALILTGRTPLTRDPKRAALVTTLRKAGATVEYMVADITQADEVAALFDYIDALYGPPVGVIHAAGIVRPQSLRSKSQADLAAVLAPKVTGAWLLTQELQRRALKPACFVLFSSIAAILPGFSGGLSDYAAANAFLDALAVAERKRGQACTVINWSIWAETGMGAQASLLQHLAAQGLAGLTAAEGISAFYRALAADESQVIVCKPQLIAPSTAEATLRQVVPPPADSLVLTTRNNVAIEESLQALIAAILKVAPAEVSKTASFMNLGIDSMDALDLVQKLEKEGFSGLPATLFFEYQTIADLARYLGSQTHPPDQETRPAHSPLADSVATPLLRFALTPLQRAFAINHLLYPERPAVAFLRQAVEGAIDIDLLQEAVRQIAARHPLLRTRFAFDSLDTEPPQAIVYPPHTPALIPTLAVVSNGNGTAGLADLEDAFINRPFDLAEGCPWRLLLVVDAQSTHYYHLLLALHHIVGDAWSLSLVAHELWTVYTAWTQGRTLHLPMPPSPLQVDPIDPPQALAAQSWWRQQLTGYADTLPVPLPFVQDPEQLPVTAWAETRYAAHATHLTPAQTEALTALAAAQNLSLFHLVLALYLRSLHRWSGLAKLIVNVADIQRPAHIPGVMAMVGSFADTLPLGLTLTPTESALDLAQRIRQAWLAIQQQKAINSLDLVRLLAEVAPATATTQPRQISPLGFSFARFAATPPVGCPITINAVFGRTATPAMRLSLVGWEFEEALHFSWNYLTPLFDEATVTALAAIFTAEVAHLMNSERVEPVETGQQGSVQPPQREQPPGATQQPTFVPLYARVQAQCHRTPDAVAVWATDGTLTYAELDRQADQVAATLGGQAGEHMPIGLLAQPSAAAVVLLLGIMKTGAAWVPLDPAHPPARHADQLQQVGSQCLVFPAALDEAARAIQDNMAGPLQRYSLDTLRQPITGPRPAVAGAAEAIAYIIFTSGSAGRPKGVPITHRALANYLDWAVATFGYGPTDRVMQATSLCFDASVRQILAPLLTGGMVIPVERNLLNDPQALLHFIEERRITVWSSVPALWGRLVGAIESNIATGAPPPALPALRWIQVGGEALPAPLVRRWFDLMGNQQRIANLYGPTETTINATYYLVPGRPAEAENQIPIGYPVQGAHLLVCDEAGQPCPAGTTGELWIGGVGLTPGYLGDAQRTQERFMQTATGERFYRSGDCVQEGAEGALHFLGRLDEQVKVRGYRIEVGEIEAILGQYPGVRLAAVVVRQSDAAEQLLVAYLECDSTPPTEMAVRQWLQSRLPDYMAPHQLYTIERLPQMPNGKLDRQQLRSGAVAATPLSRPHHGAAPQTATEHLLAQVWHTVLGLSAAHAPLQRDDDFFALGGDSLQAIRVFVELGKVRPVLPRAAYLYRYRTLATLAAAIDAYQPKGRAALPAEQTDDHFGVSLAQAGFLLVRALQEKQATSWCARFLLAGPLQVDHFQGAVQVLVERHAMLRTVFPAVNSQNTAHPTRTPRQRIIQPEHPLPLQVEDWQTLTADERQAALTARWNTVRARRFDPAQWPLIEMGLCRVAPEEHVWFVATDHLIGDGLSGWLLGQELLQVYDALVKGHTPTLPPLRSTFREYVTLQQRHEQEADHTAEAYWRQIFAAPYAPPNLRVRTAATVEAATHSDGWIHQSLDLSAAQVQGIERCAATNGVTPYELLLALFLRQLQRLTGQQDLVVGSAIAGRDEPLPDIMRIFGAFATALPLRVQRASESWREQVQQVAQAFQSARAHTLSPRRIAQVMHPQTPLTAALGAQFLFSYMDFTALGPLQSDTLQVRWAGSQTELQPPSLAADLVLTGRKVEGELRLLFTAPTMVLTTAQLEMFVNGFQHELHEVAASGQTPAVLEGQAPPVTPESSTIRFTTTPLDRANGAINSTTPLDAALVGYLPPFAQIQPLLGALGRQLDADGVRRLLFPDRRPRWLEHIATPLGHAGLIAIPRFADELAAVPVTDLCAEVTQAMTHAAGAGARCVALAGMLPAYTRYGYALLEMNQTATIPALTTGHSTTVVAVVKSVLAALVATGQQLATLHLGCVGVGSIGSAALQLLLQNGGQPAALTLCDVAGSAARLHSLAALLRREFDYRGQVRIIEVEDLLPTELYAADLLVGATSRPHVLDVAQLAPGTIVIDDSFPACFEVERAIARMITAADVLVVGGGLLHCGAVQRTIYLPVANTTLGQQIAEQVHTEAVASCQLEALLWSASPSLPLTHGMATVDHAVQYWKAAAAAHITAAPLHLRDFRIPASLLQRMQQFIAQRQQTAAGGIHQD